MAINDKALLQPTRGTVFTAPAETPLPEAGVKAFTLFADDLTDWKNLGHTSNDNKIQFNIDGGDATTHDTWLMAGARTTYASVNLTVTGDSVQVDTDTMKFIYNGWDSPDGGTVVSLEKVEQKLALFVLCYDPGADTYFGIYLPNTSFTYSALPDITGDNFTEIGFTASVLTSTSLPANPVTGKKGTFAFYGPEVFNPAAATPVQSISLTPATATVKVNADVDLTVAFNPDTATTKTFTVDTSDATIATAAINAKDPTKVTVHGVKANANPVDVTVTSTDGKKTATSKVTVTA